MSDDQLQMLQRELMQVQQQKTNPLSERTVAQILIKLYQNGFKVYSTNDSNQYITPSQIDYQITKIVQQRGRLSLSILPQLLNLNQDLIQSRINGICSRSTHIRHSSWLVSKDYIQNLLLSIKQKLQLFGIVELDQQALKYEFDIKFLEKVVNDNISMFDSDMRDHKMITRQYRNMKKCKIFGFLLSITRPIEISVIVKYMTLREDGKKSSSNSDVEDIVRQLIAETKLKGKCQNLFYVPEKFSLNQKTVIEQFLQTNGYLEFTMLQKNYMVPKPQEWVKKNLNSNQYTIFEGICFKKSQLQFYQNQLQSLLKGEGFAEISNIIPFDLEERKMNKFLSENCQLKNFVLNQGISYSEQWLNKCVNEFRGKIIFDIFFNESKNKKQTKGKKKGASKKEKTSSVTQEQLIETLFDTGLAEYSIAEDISESLLPLLLAKLDQLKTKLQKQLSQSQGVINSNFLNYRKCKSILRSSQNLTRITNMIQKQKKKTGPWSDIDFGPNENDKNGQYSLIYYDGIIPKDWPPMEHLRWKNLSYNEIIKTQNLKSKLMPKSLLVQVLQILEHHNKISKLPIQTPHYQQTLPEQSPYVFRFYVSRNEPRFVLIDNNFPYYVIPIGNEEEPQGEKIIQFASTGVSGLVEKAYTKFRYCYKSLLSIPFQQLVSELTGFTSIEKIDVSTPNLKGMESAKEIMNYLVDKVILMAQGKQSKRIDIQGIQNNGQKTSIQCLKPYLATCHGQQIVLFPGQISIKINERLFQIFGNIWIIGDDL